MAGLGQTTFGSSSFPGIFSASIESTRLNGLFKRHSTAGACYRPPIVEQAGWVSLDATRTGCLTAGRVKRGLYEISCDRFHRFGAADAIGCRWICS
jgi:hypothetical protein